MNNFIIFVIFAVFILPSTSLLADYGDERKKIDKKTIEENKSNLNDNHKQSGSPSSKASQTSNKSIDGLDSSAPNSNWEKSGASGASQSGGSPETGGSSSGTQGSGSSGSGAGH